MSNSRKRSKSKARSARRKRKPHGGRSSAPAPLALPEQVTAGKLLHAGALGPLPARRRPLVQLDDQSTSYTMDPSRRDDCFRAAMATLLQIGVEQVPDPRLDERLEAGEDREQINRESWARLHEWLAGRALRLVFHHEALPVDADRWIGVARAPDPTLTSLVTIVSSWPATRSSSTRQLAWTCLAACKLKRPSLANVAYGITVENREEK